MCRPCDQADAGGRTPCVARGRLLPAVVVQTVEWLASEGYDQMMGGAGFPGPYAQCVEHGSHQHTTFVHGDFR